MILTGALVNGAAIVAGALVGMFGGKLMPDRLKKAVMSALALIVIGIAVPGLMKSNHALIPILSLVIGTVIGELLDIDGAVNRLGDFLQKKVGGQGSFTQGFVTGTLVFAVGAMAVMGALDSGIKGDHSVLIAKSVIDGISAVVFASTMGLGVAFSGIPVFVLEGLIAVLASVVAPYLGAAVIAEISFTGSLMILAISFNMLGITKIKVLNMTPGLLLPILLCLFM
ncbi:MAG: DUF554 domain-containing protein [Eubacteriales bacterium]|nr:DUF554 domain-containing protein [Eubacteriales bacterium]